MKQQGFSISCIITFGQPNILLTKEFQACLNLGIVKIIIDKDPTLYLFENYAHAGQQLVICSNKTYTLDLLNDFGKQVSEKSELSKFLKNKSNILSSLEYHHMDTYCEKLQKLNKKYCKNNSL